MLVEAILGNLFAHGSAAPGDDSIDWLDLTWDECLRRALSKRTRGDKPVRILRRLSSPALRHGDILHRAASSDHPTIAVHVLPCNIVIARPRTPASWVSLAYELGDLHLPMQFDEDHIVTIDDGPVLGVLDRLEIPYQTETGRFEPTHGCNSGLVPISSSIQIIRSASA